MEQVLIQMSHSRWRVLQPAIYLVSILPALICGFVFESAVPTSQLVLMGLAVVLIQHAINVFNDETDWEKGADTEKKKSWYHFHRGNNRELRIHAWMSLVVGVGIGVAVVLQVNRLEVLWLALPLVCLGFFYNHSQWALSYTHWGEWVTGICYGPGVFGCMAYVLTGRISKELILGSLACSSLAVAVLLSHQPPQVLTDFAAGKKSFAVRNGVQKTYWVAKVLNSVCLLLLALLFSLSAGNEWNRILPWLLTLGFLLFSPPKLSPPVILRGITFQTLCLGLLSKVSSG